MIPLAVGVNDAATGALALIIAALLKVVWDLAQRIARLEGKAERDREEEKR